MSDDSPCRNPECRLLVGHSGLCKPYEPKAEQPVRSGGGGERHARLNGDERRRCVVWAHRAPASMVTENEKFLSGFVLDAEEEIAELRTLLDESRAALAVSDRWSLKAFRLLDEAKWELTALQESLARLTEELARSEEKETWWNDVAVRQGDDNRNLRSSIMANLAVARCEALEEAKRAVCRGCRRDLPYGPNGGHVADSIHDVECRAEQIRALLSEAT